MAQRHSCERRGRDRLSPAQLWYSVAPVFDLSQVLLVLIAAVLSAPNVYPITLYVSGNFSQCEDVGISWTDAFGKSTLLVSSAQSHTPFLNTTLNPLMYRVVEWVVDVCAGQYVDMSVTDRTGSWRNITLRVQQSTNSSCLPPGEVSSTQCKQASAALASATSLSPAPSRSSGSGAPLDVILPVVLTLATACIVVIRWPHIFVLEGGASAHVTQREQDPREMTPQAETRMMACRPTLARRLTSRVEGMTTATRKLSRWRIWRLARRGKMS